MRIVLIGFMSSGKSTVSKLLHNKMGWPELDTDALIEEIEKKSINEIFANFGESKFREMETLVLKKIMNQDKIILATGGGIVETKENHELLKQNSFIFYLKTTASQIFELTRNDHTRPLLKTENPLGFIENKLKIREPIYHSLAHFVIESAPRPIETVVEEIYSIICSKSLLGETHK